MSDQRKSPEELVRALVEALDGDPKTTYEVAEKLGSSWETAYKYLHLILWVQSCPKVVRQAAGRRRMLLWRREWGKLPKW